MTTAYNPAAQLRDSRSGTSSSGARPKRTLMARVYQPQGAGPFPILLDVHGGAWHDKDRFANVPMDEAAAKSGVLVVAIDMTLLARSALPGLGAGRELRRALAQDESARMEGRSLARSACSAARAAATSRELVGMRPRDPRYTAIPLPEAPEPRRDGRLRRDALADQRLPRPLRAHGEDQPPGDDARRRKMYFDPWESIFEANPALILERGEKVTLPPLLIMQGELDSNVPWQIQEKFAKAYRAAGGECELEIFKGCEHSGSHDPGPQTDRAHEVLKAFIARQLSALRKAA